jgi:ribosomal protein S18 acetylase RimI-like enzyme
VKLPLVRRALPSDAGALLDLEANFPDADRISRRSLHRLLKSPTADCLVAQKEQVSGAAVMLYRKGSKRARLYSVSVSPATSGQGIGALILSACNDAAKARNCDHIRLEVRQSNIRAISLYERSGFCVIGEKLSYYDDGENALIMELKLSSGDIPTS